MKNQYQPPARHDAGAIIERQLLSTLPQLLEKTLTKLSRQLDSDDLQTQRDAARIITQAALALAKLK
ncbi:hypothetical protein [Methylomonas rhizoryzae]|uniref:hypothetical protein n=1 Tax=Methylomonas rhizoryzae TaxID=2608981 RepID=UPI001231AB56|nr:hypothetical protein [Methylomonas rhizoryzae]